ncbi:MAG: NAD-dependent epimerase/dehydratase family protein [Mycobacteriales bacterium]
MAALTGQRVLVTGGSGFIGSHLVRRLLEAGADVHVLTSAVSAVYPARLLDLRGSVELHEGSVSDRGAMDSLVAAVEPDYIFHLAAYTHVGKSWRRVDECLQTNVQGTVNLLQALSRSDYRRFVYVSTSEVYGNVGVPLREGGPVNPLSPYAVSKYAAERYCRMFQSGRGWPIVVVRPFNAYGPAQTPDRVIPEIIIRALRREPLRMTQGRQTREFNYVGDLAQGLISAATTDAAEGQVINLGGGDEISMREVANRILGLLGNPVEPSFGALPDRPGEIWRMSADVSLARELLGWAPAVSLDEGLRRTIEFYRAQLRAPSPFLP